MRGELTSTVGSIFMEWYGANRFGKARGPWLKLCLANPRDMGTTEDAGLVCAGGGFCGVSCAQAGEKGPPARVIARVIANSGRANSLDPDTAGVLRSDVIALLYPQDLFSPRHKDEYADGLKSVKRSQNGICFTDVRQF